KVLRAYIDNETLNVQKIKQATTYYNSAQFALENAANPSGYKQKVLSDTVNQFFTQYFPVLTADQKTLIFTRRLGDDMMKHDEDLVMSLKNTNGTWSAPVSISKNINSTLNEGT